MTLLAVALWNKLYFLVILYCDAVKGDSLLCFCEKTSKSAQRKVKLLLPSGEVMFKVGLKKIREKVQTCSASHVITL